MATERRESFPILEDATNNDEGAVLSLKAEGSAAASGGVNYAGMLVGKDAAGNLQFLKLNAQGELVVTLDGASVACISGEGTVEDGNAALTIVASIALQLTKTYKEIECWLSCFRDTKAIIELVTDDGGAGEAITIIGQLRVGAGQYTKEVVTKCREVTTTGTGVQTLRVRARNTNALSDIDAMLAAVEEQ